MREASSQTINVSQAGVEPATYRLGSLLVPLSRAVQLHLAPRQRLPVSRVLLAPN